MSVFFERRGAIPVFAKMASDFAVGESAFLNFNGTPTEFLVVQQGLPSSDYDASCDGTWLLMKDIYKDGVWGGADNDYENSNIHSHLNSASLGLFDSDIQNLIKQVKIPYHQGTGSAGSVVSGANGLSTKVFLLSGREIGWKGNYPMYVSNHGACLDYFDGATAGTSIYVAYHQNGNAGAWWLRSPETNTTNTIHRVTASGGYTVGSGTYNILSGVRPCIILPYNTVLNYR